MARRNILNDELEELIAEYLNVYQDHDQVVPTVVGLCCYVDVAKSTIYKWESEGKSQVLSDTLSRINEMQHMQLVNGGLSNKLNANITKLMLSNHGYSEKTEVDNKSSDGSMSGQLNITVSKPKSKK